MRQELFATLIVAALVSSGCGEPATDPASAGTNGSAPGAGAQDTANGNASAPENGSQASAADAPASGLGVPIQTGTAMLDGQNTKINFVGTKPNGDHHDGGFSKFSGKIQVDEASQQIESISVEIQTASLWSDNDKLTGHLKSPDFFNAKEHPTATFESTSVNESDDGLTVTGNLTLLGETQEVAFPAKATVSDGRLTLISDFTIDRSRFGMTYRPDQINNEVSIQVIVGAEPADAAQ